MWPTQSTGSHLLLQKSTAALSSEGVPSPNTAVNLAMGKDFTKFIDLSKDSAFFGKICPRH
jgi:hypothetical protein